MTSVDDVIVACQVVGDGGLAHGNDNDARVDDVQRLCNATTTPRQLVAYVHWIQLGVQSLK